ncbi:hypothetical protein GMLC_10630 [Geomonas limicola]|uniref:Uncharacterized protein n=1 Tax=Geomonas limicola TaxID=2740186 RepID=A0A6V8N6D7_9BACT|nr:hypothetical protein [Geomonas limicola]GFO67484.1 hypothetical protein GMLC_10630 [Geomonas limicola]
MAGYQGFVATTYQLIRSKWRVFLTSFVLSALLSTVIFIKVNYEPYYLTKGIEYEHEAKQLCKVVQILSKSLAGPGDHVAVLNGINGVISLTHSYVQIAFGDDLSFDNGKKRSVDAERSIVAYNHSFKSGFGTVKISTLRSNKPKLKDHLYRAWTWSAVEFVKDRQGYLQHKSYLRSTFLYITLAVVWTFAIFMLSLLRSKYEENIFLNSQLVKEGYYLRKEYDTLSEEIEELVAGGVAGDSDLIADKRQKLKDLEAELGNIHAKTNINMMNAKMEYFEPNYAYTIEEIREKLCISTITNNSDISVISYSDRYFQRESHVRFFIELLGLKRLRADLLKSVNISVPILKGQDREKKEEEIRSRFAKYLPTVLFEKLKIDVHNIHDKEYLHMRVMDIIGGSEKLTLTLDKGMDSLEPHKADNDKYATATRTYAVVAYGS